MFGPEMMRKCAEMMEKMMGHDGWGFNCSEMMAMCCGGDTKAGEEGPASGA
jgi:hypothetical protein